MISEHVIYTHDRSHTRRQVMYRSLAPIAMFGAAGNLDAARATVSVAMLSAIEPGDEQIEVIEHIEFESEIGFAVRVRLTGGAEDVDRRHAANILVSTLEYANKAVPVSLDSWGISDTGWPTIIACLPSDTVRDVVDQLAVTESCAIALSFSDEARGMQGCWVSGIMREEADVARGHPVESLADAGIDLDATIEFFMEQSGLTREQILDGTAQPYVMRPPVLAMAV